MLREAFDYPYPQIAEITPGVGGVGSRQLVSRARKHLALSSGRCGEVDHQEQKRMLEAVSRRRAVGRHRRAGADLHRRHRQLLGRRRAGARVAHPRAHAETVAKYVHVLHDRFWVGSIHLVEANGAPAAVLVRDGAVVAFVALDVTADGIRRFQWVLNPEKLERLPVPA
ncbi:hypothetical protein ACRAWC_21090 [Leifsonia sp. L25]|uniref:hypothetical protein n=1 Tax=Leifsonia sp. L25 TaxID=3423957 RepID=UPI003D6818C2